MACHWLYINTCESHAGSLLCLCKKIAAVKENLQCWFRWRCCIACVGGMLTYVDEICRLVRGLYVRYMDLRNHATPQVMLVPISMGCEFLCPVWCHLMRLYKKIAIKISNTHCETYSCCAHIGSFQCVWSMNITRCCKMVGLTPWLKGPLDSPKHLNIQYQALASELG